MKTKLFQNANKLLVNGSGYSIKSWFLYGTFVCGTLILLASVGVMVYDVAFDGKVDSSLADLAEVITAVSGLFVAAGLPKIAGEIFENRNNTKSKKKEEETNNG